MTPKEFYKQYQGKSYQLGSVDCFSIIMDYLDDKIQIPNEYKGSSRDKYQELYESNPTKAIGKMIEFLKII